RAELDALGRLAGLELVGIIDHARAGLHQAQVAVHRVLVEGDEHVELVAHAAHRLIAGPDGQESVAAADDGLIRVVRVYVQAAPPKDAREVVAGAGDALPVSTANADCKINFRHGNAFLRAETSPETGDQ